MRFTNEEILSKMSYLSCLEKGIKKMELGYPDIGEDIMSIIMQEESFPQQQESPTGEMNFLFGSSEGTEFIHKYAASPFSNEEWPSIILNKHYSFPDKYKVDPRCLSAVTSARDIQKKVLMSPDYLSYVKKVKLLPPMGSVDSDDPRVEYIKKGILEVCPQPTQQHISIASWFPPKRLQQIVYSIEERKYKERIMSEIVTPMMEIKEEILTHISLGGKFDCLCENT